MWKLIESRDYPSWYFIANANYTNVKLDVVDPGYSETMSDTQLFSFDNMGGDNYYIRSKVGKCRLYY